LLYKGNSHKKPQIIIMLANPLKPTSDTSISAFGKARSTVDGAPLSAEELRKIHAYWCACNYLAIGMIYLRDNPLLRAPLKIERTHPRRLARRLLIDRTTRFLLHLRILRSYN
jgi:xylulose-5-phosphate/fructose-6-phosphate phosphoketolase